MGYVDNNIHSFTLVSPNSLKYQREWGVFIFNLLFNERICVIYYKVLCTRMYEDLVHITARSDDEGNLSEESENTQAGTCWGICGWSPCHGNEP